MGTMSIRLKASLYWLVGISACGPEAIDLADLGARCAKMCELALACPPDVAQATDRERCENGCLDDGEDSLRIGADCAKAYDVMMTCVSEMTCEDWDAWVFMRDPRPCEEATAALSICPGVWFVPEE